MFMTLSFGNCMTVKAVSLSADILFNHVPCTEEVCSKLLIVAERSCLQSFFKILYYLDFFFQGINIP